jgi:hypothetical protein
VFGESPARRRRALCSCVSDTCSWVPRVLRASDSAGYCVSTTEAFRVSSPSAPHHAIRRPIAAPTWCASRGRRRRSAASQAPWRGGARHRGTMSTVALGASIARGRVGRPGGRPGNESARRAGQLLTRRGRSRCDRGVARRTGDHRADPAHPIP